MPSARRIDVHFHFIPEFYREIVKTAGIGPTRKGGYPLNTPELAIEAMDAADIATAIASVPMPGVVFAEPPEARKIARRLNEYLAELRVRWPGRFGGFAMIPMNDVHDAVAEIDHVLDTLKFEGVCLYCSYGDKYLGDPIYDPVMEALQSHKAVVYTHPTLPPSSRNLSLRLPGFIMEYLFDTTRMAVNLIFAGVLDRYPDIKFILSHAGGTLPYFPWRLASAPAVDAGLPQWPREKFVKALGSFWYDTAISGSEATMLAAKAVAGPEKILFGTDWPFIAGDLMAEHVAIHTAPGLHSDAERAMIDRGNALKLFPHLA